MGREEEEALSFPALVGLLMLRGIVPFDAADTKARIIALHKLCSEQALVLRCGDMQIYGTGQIAINSRHLYTGV